MVNNYNSVVCNYECRRTYRNGLFERELKMSLFEKWKEEKKEDLRQPIDAPPPDKKEIEMIMNKLAPHFSGKKVLSLDGEKRRGERIEEEKFKRLTVRVKEQPPRGNQHGYTVGDYAHDAAEEINQAMADQGISVWSLKDGKMAEKGAVSFAENEIEKCSDMFRDQLYIEIEDEELENKWER